MSTDFKTMQTMSGLLGDISPETFMQTYWQKKPLLVRQAFKDFQSPITADELAGLACEESVNSRIVLEKDGAHPWCPLFGPMNEETYAQLPPTHWTLVVNDLEKYLPQLSWIVDRFRFIPEWRLDDLMISYAADAGSVGPHFDLYDVFILQGQGRRRWQISTRDVAADNQVAETPLRIQQDFQAEEEWIVEPGDMLYLPPGVSHHGVSLGESLSYSIGFRATSHADIVNDFINYLTRDLSPALTYRDPDQCVQQDSNEIKPDALARVSKILQQYLQPDHPQLQRWFGRFVSDNKADVITLPEQTVKTLDELQQLVEGGILKRHPASRFAFARNPENTLLFVDGEDYTVSPAFARALCRQRQLDLAEILGLANRDESRLMIDLYNQGNIYLE